ncbi:hypothetical protein [Acinetobacter sp.]|uniref:COG3904 family protein n=1 Tax=Acinetobacter sp. TaxID=472 RepID=UPI002FDA192F
MRIPLLFIALILAFNSYAGEFTIRDIEKDGPLCPWLDGMWCVSGVFKGEIKKGDTDKLEQTVRNLNSGWKSISQKTNTEYSPKVRLGVIQISSNGGDVYESIRMGEWFRKNKVQVINPQDSPCYSACVFAMAGGVFRIGFNFGLHAFYTNTSMNPNFDYDVENNKYQKVEKDIRDYLQRMRIPSALLDETLQTPSSSINTLTFEEAKRLGIIGFDPIFHQLLVAKGYLNPTQ